MICYLSNFSYFKEKIEKTSSLLTIPRGNEGSGWNSYTKNID